MKYSNNVPVGEKKSMKEINLYDHVICVHISVYIDTAGGFLMKKMAIFFQN